MDSEFLYNDYGTYMARHFDGKVQKLSVDGGFGCPNRDGRIGHGGCAYCNNATFVPAYCNGMERVSDQLERGKAFFGRKYPQMRYLAYFQSHTNTYAPLAELRAKYAEALAVTGVVGLVIGTRPDCLGDDLLDYLAHLAQRHYVMVELGVESTDDQLLQRINRGHNFLTATAALQRAAAAGVHTAAHIILGLPGQTRRQMLDEPTILSQLPIEVLKLHQLQIVRGAAMADWYAERPQDFDLFATPQDYADLLVDYLQHLRPTMVLERFTSQSPANLLIAPRWGMKNHVFVELLKRRLREHAAWQGKLYDAS